MVDGTQSARSLIVQGDESFMDGRIEDAQFFYQQSLETVAGTRLAGPVADPHNALRVAITEALGHERLGMLRAVEGDPRPAEAHFRQAEAALRSGAVDAGLISTTHRRIIDGVLIEAPHRWQEMLLPERNVAVETGILNLSMGMRMCEHGCLSRSGSCRGHPPDPCL